MKQNKIWLVALITMSIFACNQSASTNESKTSTDSVAAKKDEIAPPKKDTTSISIGPSGVGVSSKKANVNVNDTGASVKTGQVKVRVKNDTSK